MRDQHKSAKPMDYSTDLVDEIYDRVCSGQSLWAICADPCMPTLATAKRWLAQDPCFQDGFNLARDIYVGDLITRLYTFIKGLYLDVTSNHYRDVKELEIRFRAYWFLIDRFYPGRQSLHQPIEYLRFTTEGYYYVLIGHRISTKPGQKPRRRRRTE
jgi:hypothetical protein